MTRLLVIVFMTALGFAAGYGVRAWVERNPSLPGPPGPFLGEFFHGRPEAPPPGKPINRADLIARINAVKDDLNAFQARRDEIDARFDRDLDAVLDPEQRSKHDDAMRRRRGPRGPADDNRPIPEDRLVYLLREQPGRTVIADVVIPWRLDNLTSEYKLDNDQREKVRALLRERRDRILALIDSSPPPSVIYYRLVPLVQRIAQPVPAAAAHP